MRTHRGSCHCKAVTFEFDAPAEGLEAWDCDCSICAMKRNTHVFIPEGQFRLLSGADNLACYQFETKTAKHLFCKTCGICSHYRPRSNPDCVAVTVYCIDPSAPLTVLAVRNFHGQQWESSFAASDLSQAGLKAAAATKLYTS